MSTKQLSLQAKRKADHGLQDATLIYAYADTEQKREAIEKAIPEDSTLKAFLNSERYCLDDDDLIKQLYGLK